MQTLYVLQAGDTDMHKIGATTRNVGARVAQLKVGCPLPLSVICTFKARNAFGLEKFFHTYFHEKRLQGEWFDLNTGDLDFIRHYCQNSSAATLDEDLQLLLEEEEEPVDEAEERVWVWINKLRKKAPYYLYACLGVLGFVLLDSSFEIILRTYFSEFWFGAFVVTLLMLIYSRRSLAQEQVRSAFEVRPGSDLYRYMHELVTKPKYAARIIKKVDRRLARRLAWGGLQGKMELYEALTMLSNWIEQGDLNAHAARMRLYRLFKKNQWDWPQGDNPLEAWRQHFEEHQVNGSTG